MKTIIQMIIKMTPTIKRMNANNSLSVTSKSINWGLKKDTIIDNPKRTKAGIRNNSENVRGMPFCKSESPHKCIVKIHSQTRFVKSFQQPFFLIPSADGFIFCFCVTFRGMSHTFLLMYPNFCYPLASVRHSQGVEKS